MPLVDPDDLDPARKLMYDQVTDDVGEDAFDAHLENALQTLIQQFYDMSEQERKQAMVQAGHLDPEALEDDA